MKFWSSIFMTILLLSSVPTYAALPDLAKYPVPQKDVFTGTPAPVDLSSYKGAKTYRTVLTQGAQKGPNFAGHYTVVSFGCGTQCQDNWIIDAKTGTIYDRFSSVIGQTYRLDSTLMIVNPPEEQLKQAYLK